jgi:hypothetical protein
MDGEKMGLERWVARGLAGTRYQPDPVPDVGGSEREGIETFVSCRCLGLATKPYGEQFVCKACANRKRIADPLLVA